MEFILKNIFAKASVSAIRRAKRVVKKTVSQTRRVSSRPKKSSGVISKGLRLATRATLGLGKLATIVLIGKL